jgi:hypothetical protein
MEEGAEAPKVNELPANTGFADKTTSSEEQTDADEGDQDDRHASCESGSISSSEKSSHCNISPFFLFNYYHGLTA